MLMRKVGSTNKIPSGILRGAAASGIVVALAAASMGGIGTASGTCVSITGIGIGTGCTSSLGTFALVLGDGTAEADGFLTAAIATGTGTKAFSNGLGSIGYAGGTGSQGSANGILNLAIAGLGFPGLLGVGTNVIANAGAGGADLGNLAVNLGSTNKLGGSQVFAGGIPGVSPGVFNLGANLLGNDVNIVATGVGSSGINVIGNRNGLTSAGILNNTTNVGLPFIFPNGSDNVLTSTGNLSTAFNYQGFFTPDCAADCGNTVIAKGPGAIAGAINQVNQIVVHNGPGITINAVPGNNASVLAASSTQGVVRPSLTFLPGSNKTSLSNPKSSASSASSPLKSSLKKFSDTVNNTVKKLTGGLSGGSSTGSKD